MTNTVARNGLVFFPEFCKVVLKKFREDDEDQFAQVMFKVSDIAHDDLIMIIKQQMLCGTDPHPELFRAKRYKIQQKFLTKTDFQFIMRNLPVEVGEDDIEDMFNTADADGDGQIGFKVSNRH